MRRIRESGEWRKGGIRAASDNTRVAAGQARAEKGIAGKPHCTGKGVSSSKLAHPIRIMAVLAAIEGHRGLPKACEREGRQGPSLVAVKEQHTRTLQQVNIHQKHSVHVACGQLARVRCKECATGGLLRHARIGGTCEAVGSGMRSGQRQSASGAVCCGGEGSRCSRSWGGPSACVCGRCVCVCASEHEEATHLVASRRPTPLMRRCIVRT